MQCLKYDENRDKQLEEIYGIEVRHVAAPKFQNQTQCHVSGYGRLL